MIRGGENRLGTGPLCARELPLGWLTERHPAEGFVAAGAKMRLREGSRGHLADSNRVSEPILNRPPPPPQGKASPQLSMMPKIDFNGMRVAQSQ
jgi:hypothetical protein